MFDQIQPALDALLEPTLYPVDAHIPANSLNSPYPRGFRTSSAQSHM